MRQADTICYIRQNFSIPPDQTSSRETSIPSMETLNVPMTVRDTSNSSHNILVIYQALPTSTFGDHIKENYLLRVSYTTSVIFKLGRCTLHACY
jgi:hypothetical protein